MFAHNKRTFEKKKEGEYQSKICQQLDLCGLPGGSGHKCYHRDFDTSLQTLSVRVIKTDHVVLLCALSDLFRNIRPLSL